LPFDRASQRIAEGPIQIRPISQRIRTIKRIRRIPPVRIVTHPELYGHIGKAPSNKISGIIMKTGRIKVYLGFRAS
jgi:hypothetical protein